MSTPQLSPNETDLRKIVAAINQALRGKINATISTTLVKGTSSTALADPRLTPDSVIVPVGITTQALDVPKVWPSANGNGTATLTHSSISVSDCNFDLLIIG